MVKDCKLQVKGWEVDWLLLILLFCFSGGILNAKAVVDFSRQVRPILSDNCFHCHGPDEATREADLRLDLLEHAQTVITPGNAFESELYLRLVEDDEDDIMPPLHVHRRPESEDIEIIRSWIDQGAVWEQHWAFTAPVRPSHPKALSVSDWPRNDLDALVLAHLEAEGLHPSLPARPEILARRVSFDLTGLPPELESLDRFLEAWQIDPNAAYEAYVDELLQSSRYGEHMSWSWLNAARYADTNGYQGDDERNMWRWRDWVIGAWNSNMPYDTFSIQQLAGDLLLPTDQQRPESGDLIRDRKAIRFFLASGFNRNNRRDFGSGTIQELALFENAMDRVETTSTVWLGLTIGCAKCHDHKFDPLSTSDYYGMMALFNQVEENGFALQNNSHPYLVLPDSKQLEVLRELDAKVSEAEALFAAEEPFIVERQKEWEASVRDSFRNIEPLRFGKVAGALGDTVLEFLGKASLSVGKDIPSKMGIADKWTFSLHFRVNDPDRDQAILSVVKSPDGNRRGFQLDVVGGLLRFRFVTRWNYSYFDIVFKEPLLPDADYHFAVSSDGRGQSLAFRPYLNGKSEFEVGGEINGGSRSPSASPLVLGDSPFNEKLRGVIHDIRVYDYVLTEEEIAMLAERRRVQEILLIPLEKRIESERKLVRRSFLDVVRPDAYMALREAYANRDKFINSLPTSMVMIEKEKRLPSYKRIRGNYDQLGERVDPDTPSILPPVALSSARKGEMNRLDFARWLFQENHPLTARVAVNRLWQMLWGRGFVKSPDNFGTQTPEPKYSDVLDWLATEYVRIGWDTKALLKTIVTSATYRQSSYASEALWKRNPNNELLARGPRHRLSAPAIRDQALAIGGLLFNEIGGKSVVIEEMTDPGRQKTKIPKVAKNAIHRRTLYAWWKRNAGPPSMTIFDVGDRNFCSVEEKRTNTPVQALATLNHKMYLEAARHFAEQVLERPEAERLTFAWRKITAMLPDERESGVLQDALSWYLRKYSSEEGMAEKLVGSSDVELAAWTALGNVLLNLDVTLTKE